MPDERVAWVSGASRGVGRGVAVALGAAGWTVWVTARSSGGHRTSHLHGTIEETAAAVDAAGGRGVPVACDHIDDAAVRAVVDRLRAEHGGLDLLVNNVWGGYERLNAGAWPEWTAPVWEQPLELFDLMFAAGVRAHYVALALAAPLLVVRRGLAVGVSFDVEAPDESHGVAYAMAKTADDELARGAARQLAPHGVTSVALHPGLVRTEGVMQFAEHLDLARSQSAEGVGRVVAALAADPAVAALSGRVLDVDGLADRYGVDVRT